MPEPTTGCILWLGQVHANGYGVTRYQGKRYYAHRLAKLSTKDSELCVLHKCDTPLCINPNHLYLGTKLDNARDRVNRNREGNRKGVLNGRAKLNIDLAKAVRGMHLQGFDCKTIAKVFNVHISTIYRTLRKKVWID